MEMLVQQIVAGLTTGCSYALLALALAVVYRGTKHVNFAQGEMATFSAYAALALIGAGLSFGTAILLTAGLSFLIGAAIERFFIGRLKGATPLSVVAIFIGLYMVIHSVIGAVWAYDVRDYPSPFPDVVLAGGLVSGRQLGVAGATLILLLMLWLFFRFTSLGLAMRAAAVNSSSAQLCGINARHMFALSWGVAAVLGGTAAILLAPVLYLDPHMMGGVLIYGFAAALLGGIGSIPGAVVGGLILGVVENLLGTYVVGTQLKLTVAFLVLVTVLTIRPQGLFGSVSPDRV